MIAQHTWTAGCDGHHPPGPCPGYEEELTAVALAAALATIAASGRDTQNTRPDVLIPGWEGSIGPGPGQYGQPHVYARDTASGTGNCVCHRPLGHAPHVQAAPGVPIPERLRR